MFEPKVTWLEARCCRIFFPKSVIASLSPGPLLRFAWQSHEWCDLAWNLSWPMVRVWWLDAPPSDQNPSYRKDVSNVLVLDCEYFQDFKFQEHSEKMHFRRIHSIALAIATLMLQMFFLCCAIPRAQRIAVKTTVWPNFSMASPGGESQV